MTKTARTRSPRLPTPKTFPATEPDKFTSRQAMVLARICKTPTGAQISDVVWSLRSDYGYTISNRDAWAVFRRLAELGLIERQNPKSSWGVAFYTPTSLALPVLERWAELHAKIIATIEIAKQPGSKRKPAKKTT